MGKCGLFVLIFDIIYILCKEYNFIEIFLMPIMIF